MATDCRVVFKIWQVLYWGLRDLKRVNLFEVEKPQIRMECAGQLIESEEIADYKQNPNFSEIVKHFDVVGLDKGTVTSITVMITCMSGVLELKVCDVYVSGASRAGVSSSSPHHLRYRTTGIWTPGAGGDSCRAEPHALCTQGPG